MGTNSLFDPIMACNEIAFPADFHRDRFKAKETQPRVKLGVWLRFHYPPHLGITDNAQRRV